MAVSLSRRVFSSAVLMGALFVVLVASIYVLSTMALRLDQFARYYPWLLAGNGLALAFIAAVLTHNGWRLFKDFRARVAGSRLTLKLVVLSILLALVPVTLVYGFSVRFLRANINSYFDIAIEQALDDAIELSRESLGLQMRTLQRNTISVAQQLVGVNERASVVALNALSADTEASEMTLIGPDNRIIASTGLLDDITVQPNRPDDDLVARARLGSSYVGVDPVGQRDLFIRVVTPVFSENPTRENSVLHALFPIAKRSTDLAESVQTSYQQYRQLVFLRRPLVVSSLLTLSLALLLSVMTAVWFAFYAARRMMMPVHDLVEGTRAVAEGNYGTRIYKRGQNDELGFLVQSFNYMTLQLEQANNKAKSSQRQVEQQRAYLQAVLGQISSGVITLDDDLAVRTSNQAALTILGDALHQRQGQPLYVAGVAGADATADDGSQPVLDQFAEQLVSRLQKSSDTDWSQEIEVAGPNGRRFLFVRVANLEDGDGAGGRVVVFDDMTTIISAQRDAAWSEVARRLAHEIKNPLTPIRLSAERLRHKFARKLDADDVDVLGRLTQTIENQVDSMKSMVDAFADYAAAPELHLAATDINRVLREVADLYQTGEQVQITLVLDACLPDIPVDLPRIRQLLHNLIKNALEAQQGQAARQVRIITRTSRYRGGQYLDIITQDSGPGFPVDLMNRLFEPYVTSKRKGTGLGLAIVKKIVEEHNGSITAENRQEQGAVVTVRLPYPSSGAVHSRGDAA